MRSMRRNDRAFRVGGDEFAVILPGADIDTALTAARRILAGALNGGDPTHPTEPFSLSIGVSASPSPSTKGELLYRHADAALYWCKRHGRTNAAAYDPGRHGVTPDERSIEDISAAIEHDRRQAAAPTGLPADLLAARPASPIGYEGPDPADRGRRRSPMPAPVRGGRARRSNGRARLGLPGGRGGGGRRARRGRLSQRQPVTPDARVGAVPPERA